MNLNQIRFAIAVHANASFSQAAKTCCVTQPSLSAGIDQLEKELGGKIFERTTRRVSTTPFGAHLMPLFEDIIGTQKRIETEARGFFDPAVKIVRIGASPQLQARLILARLNPLKDQHEDIEFCFKQCFLDDLKTRLDEGHIDFAISPKLPNGIEEENDAAPFFEEPLFVLRAGEDETKTPPSPVRLAGLEGELIATTQEGCGLAPLTLSLFETANIPMRHYPGRAINYQILEEWADLGIATAILPQSCISEKGLQRAAPLTHKGKLLRIEYILTRKRASQSPHFLKEAHKALKSRG